jgi:3-carboxy-cis,cis-muconate cycloisomerase
MTCREKILPAWPSSYLTGLLGDPEITALIGEPALLREMLQVESSLAKVEGRLGVIPSEAADAIVTAAEKLSIEPAALAEDVARDGVPVPGEPGHFRYCVRTHEFGSACSS